MSLTVLRQCVETCSFCHLAAPCRSFGTGSPHASVVFVVDMPEETDSPDNFMSGPEGELLAKLIVGMGLGQDYYVTSAVKCRPPQGRTPTEVELTDCMAYLRAELDEIRPEVIVFLGRSALGPLGLYNGPGWRGRWQTFSGSAVMATWSPKYLLHKPVERNQRVVSADMIRVLKYLGRR